MKMITSGGEVIENESDFVKERKRDVRIKALKLPIIIFKIRRTPV
jgi:hypothetical protein